VSEVDSTGQVLSTFIDVNRPEYLSIDSAGRMLVADYGNHRILLLGSQVQPVLSDTNSQVKLWWPTRVRYNELASQLYVVHRSSSRQSQSDAISLFNVH